VPTAGIRRQAAPGGVALEAMDLIADLLAGLMRSLPSSRRATIREFHVTDINVDFAFASLNVVLLAVASMMLVRLFAQAKELTRSTKLLTDIADKMNCIDRHAVGQVARLAREISADIGKLGRLDPSDGENRISPAE
jgi:hypothetical protein